MKSKSEKNNMTQEEKKYYNNKPLEEKQTYVLVNALKNIIILSYNSELVFVGLI